MNKAFKVLWNDVRRSYVVSSEAQMSHGKPARSSKTLVAAAVAGVLALGASSAFAALPNGPITNSNLPTIGDTDSETTKLVSGKGETIDIQTNGSLGDLAGKLAAVKDAGNLKEVIAKLREAFAPTKENVTIVGVTGGSNVMSQDDRGMAAVILSSLTGDDLGIRFAQQFISAPVQVKKTTINIGDTSGKSNPLVMGVVGGDLLLSFIKAPESVNNQTSTEINVMSGNTFGVIGGSATVNAQPLLKDHAKVQTSISSTKVSVLNTANVGGVVAGGLAIGAFGSEAESNVLGATSLYIDTETDLEDSKIDGLVVGAIAGGVAASTLGSKATATVCESLVDVDDGMVLGVVGGGAALAVDSAKLDNKIKGKFGSGTSLSTSGKVTLNLNEKSTTVAVMGGGIAFADAYGKNVGSSTATVESVKITLNGGSIEGKKTQLHDSAERLIFELSSDKPNLIEAKKAFSNMNIDGVHIANLGGGAAIARSSIELAHPENEGSVEAKSDVRSTMIKLNGGYNVATAAGGLAISIDHTGKSKDGQNLALSNVKGSHILVTGGENILVSGGGLSFATANNGETSLTKANANVGTAALLVKGGSVDGLYGGGIAVDDTASSENNATSDTTTVYIEVSDGEVKAANMDPLIKISQGGSTETKPGKRTYINETAKLFKKNDVAILGAGIASGGGAQANTETSTINLSGGTVTGNVFGGGAATLGGQTDVGTSTITLAGSKVNGNIYAGGLAGSEHNGNFVGTDYEKSISSVGTSNIILEGGELNGDIYAGSGIVEGTGTEVKSTVGSSNVEIKKNGVFKGKKIDATGVTGDATLTMANEAIDLGKATVTGFNKVVANNHAKNFTFDFGEKKATTFEGVFDVNGFIAKDGSTLTLVDDSVLATKDAVADVTFKVDNGVLALGDKADAMTAHDQLASVNAIPGLYLAGAVDLTKANATIGKVAEDATGVVIGANGSLMADAAAGTNVKGTITGTKDSGIYFTNVAEKDAKVVFEDGALKGFDLANGITVDNIRYEVLSNKADNKNTFTFEVISNQAQLYSLGLDGFDGEALNLIEKQDDAASKHIQSLLDQQNTAVTSGEHRHAQLNAAFNVATAAGVQTAGIEGAMLGLDQAAKRASLTNTFADGWAGFAEVTGTQVEMGGSRDMLESKTKLGGLAAGGEYTTGDWTFGALMNLGTGEVKGQGHNAGVKNDVDFYGVQGYAAKRLGQFNVVGQAGWVMTKNDIKHAMGDSADVDANVYTVGARGEMQMALTDSVAMVPYVGVNYLRVETDGYTTKKGFKVDEVTQDLVNVPVGVAVKGDFGDMAGWQMKPVADIAYVHTFGDTNVEAQTGVGAATMATDMDVWSENVGRVRFGLEAQKDNMSFGFTLGGAAGSDDHREVYGQINAKYVF